MHLGLAPCVHAPCLQDIRLAAVLIDDLGMEVVTRVEARLVPGDTLVRGR